MLKSSIVLYMMLFNYYIHCSVEKEKELTVIEKLPTTARVLSAIALHNGLANGEIAMEPVVSELLNLGGSHKLSTFDKRKVEKFTMELDKLKLNDKSTKIEQSLMLFYEIKKEWSVIEIPYSLSAVRNYAHWKPIIKSWTKLDEINVDHDIAPFLSENYSGRPSMAFRLAIDPIRFINKTEVQEVLAIAENFRALHRSVQLLIMIQNTKNYFNQQELELVYKDFAALEGVTSSPPEAELALIYSIVASQFIHYSNSTNRTYTAGFDDGFKSLKNLDNDFSDEFVAKLINSSGGSFQNINFTFLEKPIEELHTTWKEFGTLTNFMTIRGLMSVYQLMNGAKGALNAVNETIQSIQKCNVPMRKSNHFDELSSVISEGVILERKLTALLSLIELVEGSKSANKEDLMTKNVLSDLKTNLLIVQSSVTFEEIKYIFDFSLIGKLETMLDNFQNHNEYLHCLENTVPYLDKIGKASKLALKIREIKYPSVIVDPPKTFATLQGIQLISTKIDTKIIEKIVINSTNIKKSVELVNLKNLQSLAKVFGESVHALRAAEKLITSGSLDILLAFSARLHKIVKKEVNLKSPPELQLLLIDWEIMLSSFVKFCLSVNKWKKSYDDFLKARNNTELLLTDLGPIFTDLANIDEIDFDVSKQLVAFERLRLYTNTPNNDHVACMEALRNISMLDLSLSKYRKSLKKMPKTLKEILENSNSRSTDWLPYVFLALLTCGCLFFLGIITLLLVYCIKRRKQLNKRKLIKKSKKAESPKVAVTPAPPVPKRTPQLPDITKVTPPLKSQEVQKPHSDKDSMEATEWCSLPSCDY